MAQKQGVELDEQSWHGGRGLIEYLGGLNRDSLTLYLQWSPYFDRMSNDQALINQSMSNPALLHLLRSRDAFEARLRQMQGVEYKFGPAPKNLEDGVLVIRKQHRRKIPGEEDKVTILGTYFMVAETIYQAPSLSDILGSKILAASTAVSKAFSLASSLPQFNPASGYSYYSSNAKPSTAQPGDHSRATTPGSGELQPLAGSQVSGPTAKLTNTSSITNNQMTERALFESFRLSLQYGSEYMDENPLKGEPGAFRFTQTNEKLRADQKAKEAAAAAAAAKASQEAAVKSQSTSPTPKAVPEAPQRKGSQPGEKSNPFASSKDGVKPKRRKSKAPGTPLSPTAPSLTGAT